MPLDFPSMDRALSPKAVAVIGDRPSRGHAFLPALVRLKGNLYSVQSDPRVVPVIEKLGVRNYASLDQVPEHIDYAIIAVSRKYAAEALRECVRNKVGAVSMYTAGYAETGTQEGVLAQEEIRRMAKEAGLILLGPNCMGLHNPSAGVCYLKDQPVYEGGRVGFATQSGSHGNTFSFAAPYNGLPITKLIGFGNGVVLESADYLEFFAADPKTEAIALYIESLRDGPRFFRLLRSVTPKKPVVIWKGGQTEDGKRAAASHTAALAESMDLWRVAARQTGAILTSSLEETIDTLKALLRLPRFREGRCGLAGGMGGQGVSNADAFAKVGLRVPPLSNNSHDELGKFFNVVGAGFTNPIDVGSNRREIDSILGIVAQDPGIDVIAVQIGLLSLDRAQVQEDLVAAMERLAKRTSKPIIGIPHSPAPYAPATALRQFEERLGAAGIPSFPSYDRAATALRNALEYYRFLEGA